MAEADTIAAPLATRISIASNATLADGPTLLRIVPHWLRVFGSKLGEIAIIVDSEPLEGRIAELHRGQSRPDQLKEAIRLLERDYPIVCFISLQSLDPKPIQQRWFGKVCP